MGQYHYAANIDRLEYLRPVAFGDGAKLTELAFSSGGTLSALAALLAASSGRGFGDFHTRSEARPGLNGQDDWIAECGYTPEIVDEFILGRWAGNRVAFIGDYAKPDDLPDWGIVEKRIGEEPYVLAPCGPFGNDCGFWTDISRLGLVLIGLEESMRDHARECLLPDELTGDEIAAVSDVRLRGLQLADL